MDELFFTQPILNSPYAYPDRHWELDADGQPTNRIVPSRRSARFITPVPKARRRRQAPATNQDAVQAQLLLDEGQGLSTEAQQYDPTSLVNAIRDRVDRWRMIPDPSRWSVTPETARLLRYWRTHTFQSVRPFFCQLEAIETVIWLTEVAPQSPRNRDILDHLERASQQSNPDLLRIALKLATGAGKTTVMALIIIWQTVNAVRSPQRKRFTRGFLIVTPGITIRDRLRVLQPNDPENYYQHRELVPPDMLPDVARAKVVITNYHAFALRDRLELAAGTRALLRGRGPALATTETEGQMLQRVMPELMGMKQILVINDEAHHCYRERIADDDTTELDALKGEERAEAQQNNEAARLWIAGLEMVQRALGVQTVYDLSATPFFLRGSGYAEGTLFPWVVSDFSLMDAIEAGIVKLPRVPVADNLPGGDMPRLRNLWEHVGRQLPRKGRGAQGAQSLDPLKLPPLLETAIQALYGHYQQTFISWQQAGVAVPPVFIVVCNSTATSKLIHDYIAGFVQRDADGGEQYHAGRLELLRNFDEHGNRLARPRTLLIDSHQLESGDALDPEFRAMAADEIERFRREIVARTGNQSAAAQLKDQDLLREVMNTVGKPGRLGESVRCVVSVAMLTEGWDASSVTHVLGLRAFSTQLLCEQVVGRALRRQSYELNEHGRFTVEYADVLGIPFDFTAQPVIATPAPPRATVRVAAVSPERDQLELTFPRVAGYRVELPAERLSAQFSADSLLELTPELVGPAITRNEGIIGEGVDLTLQHLGTLRQSTLIYELTRHLIYRQFRDAGEEPKLYLFGEVKRIVRSWLDGGYLRCSGGTFPAQLLYHEIAELACERIKAAITAALADERPILAMLEPYAPTGSTASVNFTSSKPTRWQTDPRRSHVNWVICDSDWEAEFCRAAEANPYVLAYVKNQGLGFEVPYQRGVNRHTYLPDFILRVDDGRPDPLQLVVEVKGFRGEDAKEKALAMRDYWVPGVNNLQRFGRWAFLELREVFTIEQELKSFIHSARTTAQSE